ncbi:MAG: hypothetical protein KC464_33140, partial [Myxococcales bacterium]|nr:hypothetical protein [Myxococcales bacterium]
MTTPDVATATAPTPPPRIAARVRRPGVCYAVSDDGVELAVIDVTHPAFAVAIDDAELRSRVAAFRRTQGGLARLPARLRRPLLRWFLRDSELGRRIMRSDGTFMSGMDTYLLKLGPDNLDRRFHHPIDRVIADALPALSVRLRLQDVATLIAEAAAPALAAAPGRPWTIVDIAGGPALDAANALLVLRRDHPGVLDGHVVDVAVLDRDRAGPGFGARAV